MTTGVFDDSSSFAISTKIFVQLFVPPCRKRRPTEAVLDSKALVKKVARNVVQVPVTEFNYDSIFPMIVMQKTWKGATHVHKTIFPPDCS